MSFMGVSGSFGRTYSSASALYGKKGSSFTPLLSCPSNLKNVNLRNMSSLNVEEYLEYLIANFICIRRFPSTMWSTTPPFSEVQHIISEKTVKLLVNELRIEYIKYYVKSPPVYSASEFEAFLAVSHLFWARDQIIKVNVSKQSIKLSHFVGYQTKEEFDMVVHHKNLLNMYPWTSLVEIKF